ncbi:hypothetical protein RIF29_24046 [Crotalaria pallida]|uniref:Uncharacterized protein n=1 Tax=Crotalaria pallida TaxID=3830 RepID=A0AAN9EJ28_CROPI
MLTTPFGVITLGDDCQFGGGPRYGGWFGGRCGRGGGFGGGQGEGLGGSLGGGVGLMEGLVMERKVVLVVGQVMVNNSKLREIFALHLWGSKCTGALVELTYYYRKLSSGHRRDLGLVTSSSLPAPPLPLLVAPLLPWLLKEARESEIELEAGCEPIEIISWIYAIVDTIERKHTSSAPALPVTPHRQVRLGHARRSQSSSRKQQQQQQQSDREGAASAKARSPAAPIITLRRSSRRP